MVQESGKGGRRGSMPGRRKARRSGAWLRRLSADGGRFFQVYYIGIALLFVFSLLHARTQAFTSWPFGGTGDAVYEINDHQDAEMLVTVGEKNLCGAAVYGFLNELNLNFTDEEMIMTVTDASTGALLTESVFLVKNQPTSAADDNGMYFAFDDEIPRGTKVRVRLHSKGFSNRGVFFELSDEALHENVTILDGEASEQTLCLSFKHRTYGLNLLRPLLFFLLEAFAGLVFLAFSRQHRIAARPREREKRARIPARKKAAPARTALLLGATALGMFLLAEFADWCAVSRVRSRFDADMVCMDDYDLKTRAVVTEDSVLEQVFSTQKRNLCGIGLRVQNNDDGEEPPKTSFYVSAKEKERLRNVSDTVKYVEGTLLAELYDNRTGELLAEGAYEVGTLRNITDVIAPGIKSGQVRSDSDKYVWLGFGKDIEGSEDGEYRLVIRGRDTGDAGIRLATSLRTNTTMLRDGEEKKASLCLVTLFDNNASVQAWYYLIVAGMFVSVLGIGLLNSLFHLRVEYVFVVSALCMGMLFSLAVPPYCVPDERTHVDTIYRISNDLLGIGEIPGPNRIYKRACDIDASVKNTMAMSAYMYCEMGEEIFGPAEGDRTLAPAYARNALDNVTIINYIPGAVGFTLARLLGRNLLTMIMAARWFNIGAVTLLMFLAIRKAPFGKGVFALAGLLPKMLNQNVSCSYDGMIIAAVYLFLAYTLRLLYEEEVTLEDLMASVFCAWFLASNKGGAYLPLTGLLLLVPFARKKEGRAWARLGAGAFLSGILVFSFKFIVRITGILSRSAGSGVKAEGKSTLYTLSDFLGDPGKFLRILEKTAVINGQGLFGDMFGLNIAQRAVNAQWVLVLLFIFLLFLAAMARSGERTYFHLEQRAFILLLTLAGIGIISASMLLSWTEVGSETIEGLQGRYFLPYLILPVLCLQNQAVTRRGIEDQTLVWAADVLLFMVFCNLIIATLSCAPIGA